MKTLLALFLLAVACTAQSRCILVKYPCEPLPTTAMFTVLDCAGNVLAFVPYRLSDPCLGQAQYCVPAILGPVRVEVVVFAGLTPVGPMQHFNVGCP